MLAQIRRTSLAFALLAFFGTAHAGSIIQFENNTGSYQLTNYGSNLASTPDITVSYRTFNSSNNSTIKSYIDDWQGTGYGNLPDAAYADTNGHGAEIGFTVAAGHQGTIDSFNLAGYFKADQSSSYVQIVDASQAVLWSSNSLTASGSTFTAYSPGQTFTGSVFIQFGNNWNVGINDIAFSESIASPVPEPSTMIMAGLGFCGLLGIIHRQRKTR